MVGFNIYILLAMLLLSGMIWSVWFKKLTLWAALTGGACALLVFAGAGFTGVLMMTAFFVAGTAATSWQLAAKQKLKTADRDHAGRKASQVVANVGVAAAAGALSLLLPQHAALFSLAIAACFSSATADTLASELGTVYGRHFYNIMTWKPDQRGLDGVISLEGILIGVLGSVLIAFIYAMGFGWSWQVAILVIAGTAGNLADSVLGAVLERKGLLKNDAVNFLSTLVAAVVALVLKRLLSEF
jgi:uncharacterized protein (TIGR00297 family)